MLDHRFERAFLAWRQLSPHVRASSTKPAHSPAWCQNERFASALIEPSYDRRESHTGEVGSGKSATIVV